MTKVQLTVRKYGLKKIDIFAEIWLIEKLCVRRISENGKTFSLPGVEEDCGCSIFRNAWWFCWWWLWWWWWWWSWLLETGSTMSSSKISSDLFPARLDSLTRIRLWRLRCIRWKVCNNPERREDIEREQKDRFIVLNAQVILTSHLERGATSNEPDNWFFKLGEPLKEKGDRLCCYKRKKISPYFLPVFKLLSGKH